MSSPKQREGGSASWTSPGIFCGRPAESRPPHPLPAPSLPLREGLAPTLALAASFNFPIERKGSGRPGVAWGDNRVPPGLSSGPYSLGGMMELFSSEHFLFLIIVP